MVSARFLFALSCACVTTACPAFVADDFRIGETAGVPSEGGAGGELDAGAGGAPDEPPASAGNCQN